MEDFIIGKTNVSKLLETKYKKLGSGWITLLKLPDKYNVSVNMESLRILEKMGYSGVYIALSKGYEDMLKIFKKNKIPVDNIYFVDGISKLYGEKRTSTKNCMFVSGPLNIEEISTAIYEILPQLGKKKKFVFLDSVSVLNIYNNLPRTMRFSKFLTSTMKKMEVDGIMVSISEGIANKKLVKELSILCDEVIEISEEGIEKR
jgi:KaiC/GvpD/RAD55 family RecA-like ATPase